MNHKKAQVSIEYLLLFSFIAMAMLLMSYWIYDYYQVYDEKLVAARTEEIGRKLTTAAEKMFHFGPPSQTTIRANMPGNINSMEVHMQDESSGCTKCTELRFNLSYEDTPQIIISSDKRLRDCDGDPSSNKIYFDKRYFSKGLKEFQIIATKESDIKICLSDEND